MKRSMEPLCVRTDGGQIWIEQSLDGPANGYGILLDPAQVPVLIEWLQEAVAELRNSKAAETLKRS